MFSILLKKDLREHGSSLLGLLALFTIVLLAFVYWSERAVLGVSPLQTLSLMLKLMLPLAAFVVGGELIVREYMGRTRLFLETLPIHRVALVSYKFVAGLLYLLLLVGVTVALTAWFSRVGDAVDIGFFGLLLFKSATAAFLVWCIVFCFSLCGYIRIFLYLLLFVALLLLHNLPGVDETQLAPLALLDDRLFALERDVIPWRDIAGTVLLGVLFAAAGFLVALHNDGSIAEVLSRPVARRDKIVFGVLALGSLMTISYLFSEQPLEPYSIDSDQLVRQQDPPVSIYHENDEYRSQAESLMEITTTGLLTIRQDLGVATLSPVKIVLDLSRSELPEMENSGTSGIVMKADFSDSHAADTVLHLSFLYHDMLSQMTQGRAYYEPYHWLLDGYTHWVAVSSVPGLDADYHSKTLAHAAHASAYLAQEHDVARYWDVLMEKAGALNAAALGYSMVYFMANEIDRQQVVNLVQRLFTRQYAQNATTTIGYMFEPLARSFELATSLDWIEFQQQWRQWLNQMTQTPQVQGYLSELDKPSGAIRFFSKEGSHWAALTLDPDLAATDAVCRIQDSRISPVASFAFLDERQWTEKPCSDFLDDSEFQTTYVTGDFIHAAMEYSTDTMLYPIQLYSQRVVIE